MEEVEGVENFSENTPPEFCFFTSICGGCGGLWRLWRGFSEINSKILVLISCGGCGGLWRPWRVSSERYSKILVFNKLWRMWRVVEAVEGFVRNK